MEKQGKQDLASTLLLAAEAAAKHALQQFAVAPPDWRQNAFPVHRTRPNTHYTKSACVPQRKRDH